MRPFKPMHLLPIEDPATQQALRHVNEWAFDVDSLIGTNFVRNHASGGVVVIQPTGSNAFDHGLLDGLADDDHPQYTEWSQNEIVTGLWTFNAGLKLLEPGGPSVVLLLAPALAADVTHTLAGHSVTWPLALPGSKLAMKMDATGVITYESVDEVENLGIYGNGVDGSFDLSGGAAPTGMTLVGSTYFLVRDWYATSGRIRSGFALDTGGFRLFGTGTLTVDSGGVYMADGANGSNGANAAGAGTPAGGAGGGAVQGYTAGASTSGSAGHNGQTGVGVAAANASLAIGEGGAGGGGGRGENAWTGAAGGAASTGNGVTVSRSRSTGSTLFLQDYSLTYALIQGGTGGKGGSSGAGDGVSRGAAGGGGGAGGRVLATWFRTVANAGRISANGGNGGNGGNTDGNGGAGGGGGGGGGGFNYLYHDVYSGAGTFTASGGTGGSVGTMGTGGTAGTNGANGSAGTALRYCRLTGVFS